MTKYLEDLTEDELPALCYHGDTVVLMTKHKVSIINQGPVGTLLEIGPNSNTGKTVGNTGRWNNSSKYWKVRTTNYTEFNILNIKEYT